MNRAAFAVPSRSVRPMLAPGPVWSLVPQFAPPPVAPSAVAPPAPAVSEIPQAAPTSAPRPRVLLGW